MRENKELKIGGNGMKKVGMRVSMEDTGREREEGRGQER